MNLRMAVLAMGLSMGLVMTSISCSAPKAACSVDTCTGCCAASGTCEAGSTTAQCGAAGHMCVACAAAQLCSSGQCVSDGGTGGGAAGGGAGGGGSQAAGGGGTQAMGGGSGGCRQIADAGSGGVDQGSYGPDMNMPSFAEETAIVTIPKGASTDVLGVVWYQQINAFPSTPYLGTVQPVSYAACHDCVLYRTGCDLMGNNCAADYLGQEGIFNVTTSTTKVDAGTFVGTVTDVHLVRWDFTNDLAIDDGGCIDLHHGTFNAAWP
jgi:hypothetical protein